MIPKLIDTHAHINFKDFKGDGHKVIKKSLKEKVWIINSGSQYSTSKRAVKYAEKYKKGVYAVVGLHPFYVSSETFDEEKYRKLLESPKVVAIGEIGLDYKDDPDKEIKEKQKEVLVQQIELAQQSGKPIIFHCREAYNDLIELLEMFNMGCAHCPHSCMPNMQGTMHCFVGRWSQAEKLLDMGFYLSLNGIITYARDYDKVIKNTPLNRILLETDSPLLSPEPYRNKRNEPVNVKLVAEKIAEIKNISFSEVAKQTTKNARELFGI